MSYFDEGGKKKNSGKDIDMMDAQAIGGSLRGERRGKGCREGTGRTG